MFCSISFNTIPKHQLLNLSTVSMSQYRNVLQCSACHSVHVVVWVFGSVSFITVPVHYTCFSAPFSSLLWSFYKCCVGFHSLVPLCHVISVFSVSHSPLCLCHAVSVWKRLIHHCPFCAISYFFYCPIHHSVFAHVIIVFVVSHFSLSMLYVVFSEFFITVHVICVFTVCVMNIF